jgi:LuxR family maltose regulon positive regulatory protein
MADVTAWVRKQGISGEDDLSYMREFEHITLARVLITRYRADGVERSIHDAVGLLRRLLQAAEEGKRTGSVIEILVLQALAHHALAGIPGALDPLERALTLAKMGDYHRIFVDEGEPMRQLLRHAAAAGIGDSYTRRLLSAFDESDQLVSTSTGASSSGLVQPLTLREVEILRLIAAGMRNQEIADQLFISLSTVKRHISNAYGKLDVGHRTEAVARANQLNLL